MHENIVEGGRATLPIPAESVARPDGVHLTIYDQGVSLVRDRRTLELKPGLNPIDLTDVPARIEPASVNFLSLTDPRGTQVVEQNYRYDLVGREALLMRYLHEKVEITLEDGTRFFGELCSGRDIPVRTLGNPPPEPTDIILRQNDGQFVALRQNRIRDIRFPAVQRQLVTRPTLRCLIESEKGGIQQIEMVYQTHGISWTADYNVLLAANGRSFDLNGWVTIINNTGTSFENAHVKLVQVADKRVPQPEEQRPTNPFRRLARLGETRFEQAETRDLTRAQHYALKRPVSIEHSETKQAEFLTSRGIAANNYFVYDASMRFDTYPSNPLKKQHDGHAATTEVQSMLEFTVNSFDTDLPAGMMRVYQEGGAGMVLAGESRIDYAPEGEKIRQSLGRALDVVGSRVQKEFRQLSRVLLEETYEIRLRNHREDRGVRVHVPERLFRWNDWEILTSSHEYTQIDSTTIEFRVDVPAMGELVIHYVVRYIWPG